MVANGDLSSFGRKPFTEQFRQETSVNSKPVLAPNRQSLAMPEAVGGANFRARSSRFSELTSSNANFEGNSKRVSTEYSALHRHSSMTPHFNEPNAKLASGYTELSGVSEQFKPLSRDRESRVTANGNANGNSGLGQSGHQLGQSGLKSNFEVSDRFVNQEYGSYQWRHPDSELGESKRSLSQGQHDKFRHRHLY